ncbi:MAG: cobalamin-dependent protein [Dehalobacterium sp.]|jgi:methanogenic corrinoid protein MtbC1
MQNDIYSKLGQALLDQDEDAAVELAKEIVASDGDCLKGILAMSDAMTELGNKFQSLEVFLPELLIASDAMKAALKYLKEGLVGKGEAAPQVGKVVIGTVKGDVHEVGKDLVAMMLSIGGFEVQDLRVDVAPSQFIATAESMGADIIGLSALMTTTIIAQRDVIEFLEAKGVRDKYKVIVGGGGVSQAWVDEIGADGFAKDAIAAVELAKNVLQK